MLKKRLSLKLIFLSNIFWAYFIMLGPHLLLLLNDSLYHILQTLTIQILRTEPMNTLKCFIKVGLLFHWNQSG